MKGLRRSNVVFIATLMTCTTIACERKVGVTESGTPPSRVRSEKRGSVSGTVRARPVEAQKKILPDAVRKVCGDALVDKTLMVSSSGGLANAVVWVADAPADEGKPGE